MITSNWSEHSAADVFKSIKWHSAASCLALGWCLLTLGVRRCFLAWAEFTNDCFGKSRGEYLFRDLTSVTHGREHVVSRLEWIFRASQVLRPVWQFIRQNLTADNHALVTDVDSGSGDEFGNLSGEFAAERTATRIL